MALLPAPTASADTAEDQRTNASGGPTESEIAALRQECETKDAADSSLGWFKDRFTVCMKRPVAISVYLVGDLNYKVGHIKFDAWVLGFAENGSRSVTYVASAENFDVRLPPAYPKSQLYIRQTFTAADAELKLNEPLVTERNISLESWNEDDTWRLTYTSPVSGPKWKEGNYQINSALISMNMDTSHPGLVFIPDKHIGMFNSNVRFDSAGKIAGKHKGTVFEQYAPTYTLVDDNSTMDGYVTHISDALYRPERTFPSWVGKSTPGSDETLHRLINEQQQADNRKAAKAVCKDVWGPDYAQGGLECDEYPFASTYEGAAAGDNRFSARPITASANQAGGRDLTNGFYKKNRMLDGDAFYVRVLSIGHS